jgi:ribosomal protein S18 acetylase RimI-like enzyme
VSSVEPLRPEHHRVLAGVYADAFMDDPGWNSIGPRRRSALWRFIERTCLSTMRAAERWCGPSWCVVEDGKPVAGLIGSDPGRWPPPELPLLAQLAPGPVRAGPGPLFRALRAERVFERLHPKHEHFLVWVFAVSPRRQRSGLGRRLMTQALERAEAAAVPAYLWTANPANVPYYRSHGFETFAEADIPGPVKNWFMERPATA